MKLVRNFILKFFFLLLPIYLPAQINLVRNPSFEEYSHCPTGWDQIRYANYWNDIDTTTPYPNGPLCSADYCNSCANPNGSVGVPLTDYFFHYPRSGNGMVQMVCYCDNSFIHHQYERDYVQGRFFNPLTAGKAYCVTFYVSLEQLSQYAINRLGAYIDNGSIDAGQDSLGCAGPQTFFVPQIIEDTIINDTVAMDSVRWHMVQGTYTAIGGETFITIGNFYDVYHTDTVRRVLSAPWNTVNNYAFYLLDDVSVIAVDATANAGPDQMIPFGSTDSVQIGDTTGYLPCYWYKDGVLIDSNTAGFKVHPDSTSSYVMQLDVCGNITTDTVVVYVGRAGIHDPGAQLKLVTIYPNPTSGSITIKGAGGCSVKALDRVGRVVSFTGFAGNSQVFDLPVGVNFIEIQSPETGEKIIRKVIRE